MELRFDIAEKFYKKFLEATTGIKSRDQVRREANSKGSKPFDKGRDPIKAGQSLDQLIGNFQWTKQMDQAALFTNWEKIVGADSSSASEPYALNDKVLVVKCRSTAWATQLRLLEKDILRRVNADFPDLEVTEIRFQGPNAPSWKKGPRSVPGRGPRDTYG